MSWVIEEPTTDDAAELARVHVAVWREAYAALMPAAFLASLDPVAAAASWRERLADPVPDVRTWIARDADGICGMTSSGPARDEDAPTGWQLYAINVLARVYGTGIGDALLDRAIGDRAAYLWIAEGNARAAAFYRRHGFAEDGGRATHASSGTTELRMSRARVAR